MKKDEKKFDAVKTMREIRDRLSQQFEGMNYEAQKRYMREWTKVKPRGVRNVRRGKQVA